MTDRRDANSGALAQPGQILVFEWNHALADAISSYLNHRGMSARCPESPSEIDPDELGLVIVGGEDAIAGTESLVSTIRGLSRGETVPIVLLADAVLENNPSDVGVDAVLVKPFQMKQLEHIISSLVSNGSFARRDVHETTRPDLSGEPMSVPPSGHLSDVGFAEIFAQCWRAAFSGSVTLNAGSTWRRLDFNNGFPVSARSNLVTEHLHRYLLRHGYISPETYRRLLPKTQGGKVGPEIELEQEGILNGIELDEARRRLVDEIISQCFRWNQAEYRIQELDEGWVTERFDVNPFTVYQRWLLDPSESTHLKDRITSLVGKEIEPTPRLREHAHLIDDLLTGLSIQLTDLESTIPAGNLSRFIDEGPPALAVMVTLADLQVIRPVTAMSYIRPKAEKQQAQAPSSGRKLKRLRQMVREDQARVRRAKSAYVVLGLTEGASNAEVGDTYRRLSRFYRPENFARLGDVDLQRASDDLLVAFHQAATEILGDEPSSVPIADAPSAEPVAVSDDDHVLAEVFFDDGNTYLRIGALDEALAHYARARALDNDNTKYLSYHAWCTYQLGRDDPARAMAAKQTLLAALKLDRRNDRALYFLGCLYEDTGREERAIECWKEALRINSGNFDARAALRRVGG